MTMNNEDYLQLALSKFNLDTPNWFTWEDFSGGATYENLVIREGVDADKPTLDEVNTKIAEIKLDEVRAERNAKLAETDWTQSRDVTLSNDSAWATYRQALRDITDSATSLDDVTWPTKPSE